MIASEYSLAGKRVWVAGHRGMVGSALVRRLARENCEIITVGRDALDLTRQAAVERWMAEARPQAIFLPAARVGGILANAAQPVDFLLDNIQIATNVIASAASVDVEKLVFLGSSCIYPKFAPQPIEESALLTGLLEPTNEAYAIAKIAGLKLCSAYRVQHGRDFVSAMPTNLYGPGDNFDLQGSHVLPALIRKAHEAKQTGAKSLVVLGTGSPLREFMHVDDCADALITVMRRYSDVEPINVGTGEEISIGDLGRLVAKVVGLEGRLEFDTSKPDGTPRKLMSDRKLRALGWSPSIRLEDGIREAYAWFLAQAEVRGLAPRAMVNAPQSV